jgi:hypothetical protein
MMMQAAAAMGALDGKGLALAASAAGGGSGSSRFCKGAFQMSDSFAGAKETLASSLVCASPQSNRAVTPSIASVAVPTEVSGQPLVLPRARLLWHRANLQRARAPHSIPYFILNFAFFECHLSSATTFSVPFFR